MAGSWSRIPGGRGCPQPPWDTKRHLHNGESHRTPWLSSLRGCSMLGRTPEQLGGGSGGGSTRRGLRGTGNSLEAPEAKALCGRGCMAREQLRGGRGRGSAEGAAHPGA